MLKSGIASIGIALLVLGCASAPTGPNVTVLPGDEKTIEEFHADDTTCRQWAAQQSGAAATEGSTTNGRGWSSAPAQRSYDLAYAQCMYTKGNQVPITNSLQAGLVPVSRDWQEEAEKAALRRKIMRAGGDTGVIAFEADDLARADAEVFRCAAANAQLGVPAPPAGTPPAPPPSAPR